MNIAFNMECTTGSCTRGIVTYMVARKWFEENPLDIGNRILQRILGLRLLVCGSRTYWVIVALSSCNVFYFPTQRLRGFALSDISDKPWSRASSLLPPGTCLRFLSRIGFSIPTARRFSSSVASSRSRAFCQSFFYARKSSYEYVHMVRIQRAKLILVGQYPRVNGKDC